MADIKSSGPTLRDSGRASDSTDHEDAGPSPSLWARIDKADLVRIGVVAGCALIVGLGITWPTPRLPLVALVGLVVGLWPIVVEAWEDIRSRRMSMELSMLIAIIAAAAIGEWVTALVVCAFVLAAEILEDLAMDQGHDALTSLMSFLPAETRVLDDDGQVRVIPREEVQVGHVVVVPPGDRICVDGDVVAGASSVDQSRITGEPLPVDVAIGASVYAGSINQAGILHVRATRVGADSSYGQIVEAVSRAQSSRPPVQRLADRFSAYLVYIAIAAAIVTFIVTRDWSAAISVVLVAGACGVAAGTPLAVLAAIVRSARHGAFVKDGTHLEQLSAVDTMVFDKTGTLTTGQPEVTGIRAIDGVTTQNVLAWAAGAEAYSEHPLGRAIVAYAQEIGVALPPAEDFSNTPGVGVTAIIACSQIRVVKAEKHAEPSETEVLRSEATITGASLFSNEDRSVSPGQTVHPMDTDPQGRYSPASTTVEVTVDDRRVGTITLSDTVRVSAPAAVASLRDMGVRTVMLSGDAQETTMAVARDVGIAQAHGGLLPTEKLATIDAERAAGHTVAMVGDGVNDAPALAHASVGIAMGSGTQIARHSADIILISSDLNDLAAVVQISRRARRIIWFNFIGTLVVDAVGMLLAAFGLIGPTVAAIIHVTSESAFILNSARLLPRPQGRH